MSTEVFIIKSSADEITNLKQLFTSSIFNVNEVVVPKPIGLNPSKLMTMDDIYEAYQYQWCLTKAKEKNSKMKKNSSVLLIKTSSTTKASNELIARFINELNNCNDTFDLFYLCRWKDECQKITDIREIESTNIKIGRTYFPSGLEAIYFSPSGIDIFLGNISMKNNHILNINMPLEKKLRHEISEGNIVAWCTIGNIFSFDVTKAISNSDYIKTHECDEIASLCSQRKDKDGVNSSAFYNYIWVIIILIIIIIVVIVILSIRK